MPTQTGSIDLHIEDKVAYGRQSVRVWTGTIWPTSSQTGMTWTDDGKWVSVTAIFSGYSSGAQNYQWQAYTVPREYIRLHNGQGHTIFMGGANFSPMGCKYIYFYLDHLAGADYNDDTGTNNGITFRNNAYVIREIYLNY